MIGTVKQSPIITEIAKANFLIALLIFVGKKISFLPPHVTIRLTLGTVKQTPIIMEIAMANFLIALLIRR